MDAAAAIGRRSIKIANSLVNALVFFAVALLLAFGCYSMWDAQQVFSAAGAAKYEKFKPTAENSLSFSELQAINPDVFAWLCVYGTNIDYPVVQGEDNVKYVNCDAQGKHSLAGALFLDANSARSFSDFSSIIYGHHMEKQTMFGEIGLFSDKSYFDERRYGTLYYEGREHGLELFAFIHTDAYNRAFYRTGITDRAASEAYLGLLLREAAHTRRDVAVTAQDKIILMSTCSGVTTNGRDILIGKITHEIHSNPFHTKTKDPHPVIDKLAGLWAGLPVWCRAVLAVLPLLVLPAVILMCIRYIKKKQKRKKPQKEISGNAE